MALIITAWVLTGTDMATATGTAHLLTMSCQGTTAATMMERNTKTAKVTLILRTPIITQATWKAAPVTTMTGTVTTAATGITAETGTPVIQTGTPTGN